MACSGTDSCSSTGKLCDQMQPILQPDPGPEAAIPTAAAAASWVGSLPTNILA